MFSFRSPDGKEFLAQSTTSLPTAAAAAAVAAAALAAPYLLCELSMDSVNLVPQQLQDNNAAAAAG
jgi:hypothetical protein